MDVQAIFNRISQNELVLYQLQQNKMVRTEKVYILKVIEDLVGTILAQILSFVRHNYNDFYFRLWTMNFYWLMRIFAYDHR